VSSVALVLSGILVATGLLGSGLLGSGLSASEEFLPSEELSVSRGLAVVAVSVVLPVPSVLLGRAGESLLLGRATSGRGMSGQGGRPVWSPGPLGETGARGGLSARPRGPFTGASITRCGRVSDTALGHAVGVPLGLVIDVSPGLLASAAPGQATVASSDLAAAARSGRPAGARSAFPAGAGSRSSVGSFSHGARSGRPTAACSRSATGSFSHGACSRRRAGACSRCAGSFSPRFPADASSRRSAGASAGDGARSSSRCRMAPIMRKSSAITPMAIEI
jgi:hypothetical protein